VGHGEIIPEGVAVEPVAWRWRPLGGTIWFYDPEADWLEHQGDAVEKEPLYAVESIEQDATVTRVEVLGHPDKPVAAPCAIGGCQYGTVEQDARAKELILDLAVAEDTARMTGQIGLESLLKRAVNRLAALQEKQK